MFPITSSLLLQEGQQLQRSGLRAGCNGDHKNFSIAGTGAVCCFFPSLRLSDHSVTPREAGERVWQSESVASKDNGSGEQTGLTRGGLPDCTVSDAILPPHRLAGWQEQRGRRGLRALIRSPKSIRHRCPTPLTVFFLFTSLRFGASIFPQR
ncbi:predicted protein [Chaetomium globosum CBS 148.51]|uniref:Uncharacterized protein n=1 Tax=Chaetomium globosum (strain ATCC 6205 / CBS 148.51 / DSM 1962 / NBRC 6347 / NRRL 1970) TaxID=306901 RepID=Q2HGM1_CHAGB|nr:uncharacterized protein CHGG_00633 [Chaetomium globosum CBS 148.51]EAQ92398.1 predicted protein [Chaetomium globosum CBS 148.51]